MTKKSIIIHIIVLSVLSVLQFLLLLSPTPFKVGFAAVMGVSTLLTLLITKRYIPAACFCAVSLLLDLLIAAPGYHVLFYIFVIVSAALIFASVIWANKAELGLLLSDALGVLIGYVPLYLAVKYVLGNFIAGETYEALCDLMKYPLMIGFIISAVIVFFAVPASNVIARGDFDQYNDKGT